MSSYYKNFNKKKNRGYDRSFHMKATSETWKAGDTFDESGSFESVRYQSEDGFIIGTFLANCGEKIVCKGTLPGMVLGAPYKIQGKVVDDKTWGIQVNISHVSVETPTTKSQLVSFLGSGAITGIGPATAKKIVDAFGEDTLAILEETPERLLEVSGIGKSSIKKILKTLPNQLKYREVIGFFAEFGISMKTISRLIEEYGTTAPDKIKENPYILCRVRGFAFSRADSIAMKLGISPTAQIRIDAGIVATLRWLCDNNGHTLIPRDQLLEETIKKLQINDAELLANSLDALTDKKKIIADEQGIHLRYLYNAEKAIKSYLKHSIAEEPLLDERTFDKLMDLCSKENDLSLTDEQTDAVRKLYNKRVSILCGSAGTGKTASCRMAVDIAKKAGIEVCLMSPTGRASKHLAEVCGTQGYTMHRALAIIVRQAQDDDFFSDDEDTTIKSRSVSNAVKQFNKSDIVIADEASMMDTEMASILFKACRNKHLMLVGDPNQLPSVGAGRVLGDLLESSYTKVHGISTILTKIFRQAEGSPVIDAAARVQEGKSPIGVKGATFLSCETNEEVQKQIKEKVLPELKERGLGYEDYMFLSPIKKTPYAGVNPLNEFLRPLLNPHYQPPKDDERPHKFMRGDRVLATKNDYEAGIFNGDLGIVDAINKDRSVDILFADGPSDEVVSYASDELTDLTLAYAMSVHKSQGGQADTVIVVMTSSQFPMLNRNLLYTAVTRAENRLILIGDAKAFAMAASNRKEDRRMTGLRGI